MVDDVEEDDEFSSAMRAQDHSNEGDELVDDDAPIETAAPIIAAGNVDVSGSFTRLDKGKQREVTELSVECNICY